MEGNVHIRITSKHLPQGTPDNAEVEEISLEAEGVCSGADGRLTADFTDAEGIACRLILSSDEIVYARGTGADNLILRKGMEHPFTYLAPGGSIAMKTRTSKLQYRSGEGSALARAEYELFSDDSLISAVSMRIYIEAVRENCQK